MGLAAAPVDLEGLDAIVGPLVVEAGEIALRLFRTGLSATDKAAHDPTHPGDTAGWDPVTDADRATERFLRRELAERFPRHQIVGEEHGASGPETATARWYIDPIDGTKAFVTGVPAWGVLVGLMMDNKPVAGWLRQPYLRETFGAVAGRGWFHRDGQQRPLRARPTTDLATASLYATHPSMFTTAGEQESFARLSSRVRMTRFGGDCYSYALLALGHIDLVVEASLQPYDILPLVPIVESAGAVITDRDGKVPVRGGFVVAACSAELHARAMEVVNADQPEIGSDQKKWVDTTTDRPADQEE